MVYKVDVDGMHCMGCISTVKFALSEIPSAKIISVKPGKVEIESPEDIKDEITKKIEFYGYKVKEISVV
jgi:copper chaperone CopZ